MRTAIRSKLVPYYTAEEGILASIYSVLDFSYFLLLLTPACPTTPPTGHNSNLENAEIGGSSNRMIMKVRGRDIIRKKSIELGSIVLWKNLRLNLLFFSIFFYKRVILKAVSSKFYQSFDDQL